MEPTSEYMIQFGVLVGTILANVGSYMGERLWATHTRLQSLVETYITLPTCNLPYPVGATVTNTFKPLPQKKKKVNIQLQPAVEIRVATIDYGCGVTSLFVGGVLRCRCLMMTALRSL